MRLTKYDTFNIVFLNSNVFGHPLQCTSVAVIIYSTYR